MEARVGLEKYVSAGPDFIIDTASAWRRCNDQEYWICYQLWSVLGEQGVLSLDKASVIGNHDDIQRQLNLRGRVIPIESSIHELRHDQIFVSALYGRSLKSSNVAHLAARVLGFRVVRLRLACQGPLLHISPLLGV